MIAGDVDAGACFRLTGCVDSSDCDDADTSVVGDIAVAVAGAAGGDVGVGVTGGVFNNLD